MNKMSDSAKANNVPEAVLMRKTRMMKLADLRIKAIAIRSDLYSIAAELHEIWMDAFDNKAPRAFNEIEEVLDAVNYAIEHLQDVD